MKPSSRQVQDIVVALGKAANTQAAVVHGEPLLKCTSCPTIAVCNICILAQIEHQSIRKILLDELPHRFGQRRRVPFAIVLGSQGHDQPISPQDP